MLFVGAFVLLLNPWLVPLTVVLCLLYGVYRVVRAMVLSQPPARRYANAPAGPSPFQGVAPAPVMTQASTAAAVVGLYPFGLRRKRRTPEPAVAALVMKSTRDRVTELVGSLLLSALVAIGDPCRGGAGQQLSQHDHARTRRVVAADAALPGRGRS